MAIVNLRIVAFLILLGCRLTLAEDVVPGTSGSAVTSTNVSQLDREDMYIFGLFSFVFAVLVSFITVVIGQYAWIEDKLMTEYMEKAIAHEAIVLSADFSRATTSSPSDVACSSREAAQSEYLAYIEYRASSKDSKKAMIRKQVKVLASDFKKTSHGAASDIPHAIKFSIEFAPSFSIRHSEDDVESLAGSLQEVEVMVMPDYPQSGLPRSQVIRTCSFSYRLPTLVLIMFLTLLSGLCLYISVTLLPVAWRPSLLASHVLALLVLVALLLADVAFMVGCLASGMRECVRELYLEGGEFMKISHDDTTISSGDDSYLIM